MLINARRNPCVVVSGALTVVPQQYRLVALAPPSVASVAIGLNGSVLFIGSALGATIGGAVFDLWGAGDPTPAIVGLGLFSMVFDVVVRPEPATLIASGVVNHEMEFMNRILDLGGFTS
jgi:predicted MFS family arabinose efflux permease